MSHRKNCQRLRLSSFQIVFGMINLKSCSHTLVGLEDDPRRYSRINPQSARPTDSSEMLPSFQRCHLRPST